jgi:hypothetical protein
MAAADRLRLPAIAPLPHCDRRDYSKNFGRQGYLGPLILPTESALPDSEPRYGNLAVQSAMERHPSQSQSITIGSFL